MDNQKASGSLPENHLLYAPGLKWRSRVNGGDVPIWLPPAKDVKAGYAPKSITLDRTDSQADIAAACRLQQKDLIKWRKEKNEPPKVRYTISWLIDRYLSDSTSKFHKLKPDTQQSYLWECKRIRETVGERRLDPRIEGGLQIPRITGEDVRRWFHNWGHPEGKAPTPSRATHCIAMLRTLASYYVELTGGANGSAGLRDMLSAMRFDKPPAREMSPDYAQVDAFVNKAEAMGYRSIAVATLAQYELMERRAHIVGQWYGEVWGDGWVWEGVSPEWVIRYFQTKKGKNLREFDLKTVQRLLGMMQETPKDRRKGPIIICEDTGEPWDKRRYQEKFREIATAAGLPTDFQSRDMRAGGATEADAIPEVTDRMFDDAGGWRDPSTKHIYRRQKQRNAQNVVELRQAARDKQ